jgi:hypothetical protein
MAEPRDELDRLQASWGRFVEDPWPTGLLILRKALEKGLNRRELARRLGTGDPGRARSYLDRCLSDHQRPIRWRGSLVEALALSPEEISGAEEEDRRLARRQRDDADRLREEAERVSFRPHAWVIPESSIPSPVFVVAIYGQDCFRRVDLPEDIASRPEDEQLRLVRGAIREHFREREGRAGPFGAITGYLYRRNWEETIELSIEGAVVDPRAERPPREGCVLYAGNRILADGRDPR